MGQCGTRHTSAKPSADRPKRLASTPSDSSTVLRLRVCVGMIHPESIRVAVNSGLDTRYVKGGPKLDHGGGGKLDHPARWTACLRVAVRPGWSGGWARLWAGPDGAEARLHSQQRAKGGVRTPERQRRGGRACCVRGDSCRRSAPECGRDGSTGRAARRSAGQSRRSRSIR